MIKQTITYANPFTGETESEDLYFNLNKAELIELSVSRQEGFEEMLKRIVASNNNSEIYATFKDIILRSYGKRSDDGKRFIKSPEISEEFSQTEAFSEFIFGLLSDSSNAVAFVNGVMPADLMKQAEEAQKKPQDFQRKKVPLAQLQNPEEMHRQEEESRLRIENGYTQ